MTCLTIATRKSPLAMWQAEFIKAELERTHQGLEVRLLAISTRGDKILDSPLSKIGGKGLFVKELEQAMLSGEADIAVHSMKDVPMHFPDELCLGPICERGDPHDAFVSSHYRQLDELPEGAIVGTSSLRRQCQLLQQRPDLGIRSLRGNVQTRLGKLDAGEFDAIVLAASGLKRLGMHERIASILGVAEMLPACGQGALGIEYRKEDDKTAELIAFLNHPETEICVKAERAMNTRLNGGCQVPIAGYASIEKGVVSMRGIVGSVDGVTMLEGSGSSEPSVHAAEAMGESIAEQLLSQGADRILAAVYNDHQP